MPTLTLSPGLTVHYLDVNPTATDTVLLLHGLGADGTSWHFQIDALAQAGYRVVAPDLRGFGRSTYPGSGSPAAMAQDVAELLRHLACGPVAVVGLSMGGTVALHLALDHAAAVRQLVLVNTFDRLRPARLIGWMRHAFRYACLATLGLPTHARLVSRHTFPHPHQAELRRRFVAQIIQANWHGYLRMLRALGCFNVRPRLAEIQAPTLVVTGSHDKTISPRLQGELCNGIPGARQVIIPDGGHAVTVDQPEAFNQALLEFLTADVLLPVSVVC